MHRHRQHLHRPTHASKPSTTGTCATLHCSDATRICLPATAAAKESALSAQGRDPSAQPGTSSAMAFSSFSWCRRSCRGPAHAPCHTAPCRCKHVRVLHTCPDVSSVCLQAAVERSCGMAPLPEGHQQHTEWLAALYPASHAASTPPGSATWILTKTSGSKPVHTLRLHPSRIIHFSAMLTALQCCGEQLAKSAGRVSQ